MSRFRRPVFAVVHVRIDGCPESNEKCGQDQVEGADVPEAVCFRGKGIVA
jgi:hypothetical protein